MSISLNMDFLSPFSVTADFVGGYMLM